jgi:hypothetical protein
MFFRLGHVISAEVGLCHVFQVSLGNDRLVQAVRIGQDRQISSG